MNDAILNLQSQFTTLIDMYKGTLILDSIKPNCAETSFSVKNLVDTTDERSPLSQKFFNSCSQYLALFRERSYHVLFNDYSIARFNYEFEGNKLASYNLLWFPCPFSHEYLEIYDNDRLEIEYMLDYTPIEETYRHSDFTFRSPVRIDYDANYTGNKKVFHPTSHLHFQHKNTRTEFNDIFCLYKFFFFVIENFYPDLNFQIYKDGNFITSNMLNESRNWLKTKKVQDEELGGRIHTSFSFAIK
ncbi:Uncharacterized conserved protein [Paenibacillus sp. OK060]|uniref:DUF2290 domain-containing protein n=1 Tax=Paenibacillus sp. OK060 TaxID=1881034 RepID=UPI00088741CA|nr:DUF2290 domain-containing protein [Paenibacillus sp. OK060]SDM42915.1 Uncharacterized conserved protein [Paenibacillus sp. OK060]